MVNIFAVTERYWFGKKINKNKIVVYSDVITFEF